MFPPLDGQRVERRVRREVVLQTTVGEVRVEAWYGRRRSDGQWIYPLKEVWELGARETRSPELKDRLAHIISLTGTFEEAAALARRMDLPGDDSTLHTLAGRLGQECLNQLELALDRPEAVDLPAAQHDPEDPLVVMMDGWMARFRGPDWGSGSDSQSQTAVLWQEVKMAVSYRLGQALEKGRRGWLSEKSLAIHRGQPLEFGRRMQHAARRRGLGRARQVLVVADGAPWIWNLTADRLPEAQQCLDFYHAAEHVWDFAKACWEEKAHCGRRWAKKERDAMKKGDVAGMIQRMERLIQRDRVSPEHREVMARCAEYFRSNQSRMKYPEWRRQSWPIGSGAIESACRGLQCRFKRPGQTWSPQGFDRLAALRAARSNGVWETVLTA